MADEKEKDEAAEADKKSGGLKPVILVALGAALGGGGVVMFTKPPAEFAHEEPKREKLRELTHPDEMQFVFNPIKERGSTTARIKLKFVYLVNEEFEKEAVEAIRTGWDRAYDRCLEVMTEYKSSQLKDPDGKRQLKRRLVDELTLELFPEKADEEGEMARVAIVEDILWMEFFQQ